MTRADPEYGHLSPLLERYAALPPDHADREKLRDELVRGFLPVAQHIARRFSNRGEPLYDLVQVANGSGLHGTGEGAVDPAGRLAFEQIASDEVAGGQVLMAGDRYDG